MGEVVSDQVLVERAQSGDEAAFATLILKYQRKLLRLISRFIQNPGEAEDVTQDVFIKAYRALPTFRGESAFYTWLYRIGVNTAKNQLQTNGRRVKTLTDYDIQDAEEFADPTQTRQLETPETLLQSKQMAEVVNQAMNSLPEELRTAIMLRELEGLSYEEIAQTMNCPIGTVRSRIFRARDAIADALRPLLDLAPERRW